MSLSLFFVILIAPSGIYAQRECDLGVPRKSKIGRIYFNIFQWQEPEDSFGREKDYILHGSTVQMSCPNGFVRNDLPWKNYTFECTDGKFNGTLSYDDFMCKSDFHKDTRVIPISDVEFGSRIFTCRGEAVGIYQVGVNADGEFETMYKVCYDRAVMGVKFVFQSPREENPVKDDGKRADVWGFDYFGTNAGENVDLSGGYVEKIQKSRVAAAFPNRKYRKKYPYYFNRGHLAPYADFVTSEGKRASCEYINVAPQWREFNGNSWSVVERLTRELFRENPFEWEIYTGVYGSIPTQKGPLFVSRMRRGKGSSLKGYVPVPKLFWKVAYNLEFKNRSRVFVGVNNPELTAPEQFGPGYLICQPKLLPGGTYFRGSEFKGFTYECDLDEFLERLAKDENIVKVSDFEF